MLRLEAELFLRLEARLLVDPLLLTGLFGLVLERLYVVAEMGMRGGGIISCLLLDCGKDFCDLSPKSVEPPLLPLELPRFHEMLSFRLRELIDDGVGGSSVLSAGGGDIFVCFES